MTAVQMVEIEAALQRVARGEGDYNDANLLRSLFQVLINEVRVLQGMNHGDGRSETNAENTEIRKEF